MTFYSLVTLENSLFSDYFTSAQLLILSKGIKVMLIKALTFDLQEMFCKQKGYLEEELDYRKQALDQAYMVQYCSIFSHFFQLLMFCFRKWYTLS